MSFNGKVVIVTGAGSGIAKAIAIHFAELSASLVLIDINPDNLSKAAEQCENLSKLKVLKVVADISNDEDLKQAVEETIEEYGKIDVVINCAGIAGLIDILDKDLLKAFDNVMNVNLRAVVAMTHYAADALIQSKGCIVNIASILGRIVCKGALPYNVSKAGVVHFTKSVALELADKGVRVNCISPGSVKTNILLHAGKSQEESDKYWEEVGKIAPLQKYVKEEDIAEMTAYLASDKAKCITGVDFVIDSCVSLVGPL